MQVAASGRQALCGKAATVGECTLRGSLALTRPSLTISHDLRSRPRYLDWDREAISPSFAPKPEYHDESGLILCKNGLTPSNFIQLDFLDFAMAVLKVRLAPCALLPSVAFSRLLSHLLSPPHTFSQGRCQRWRPPRDSRYALSQVIKHCVCASRTLAAVHTSA